MIIKKSTFKKMVKEAYKVGRLRMAKHDKWVLIHGGYWVIQVIEECIPKEYKSVLIEAAGNIPAEGDEWLVTKYGNQYCFDCIMCECFQVPTIHEELKRTAFSLGDFAMLQNQATRKIALVDEMIIDGIGLFTPDDALTAESLPEGPLAAGGKVYYENNVMTLCIAEALPSDFKEKIEYMECIDLVGEELRLEEASQA